jgi:hypothetical protein
MTTELNSGAGEATQRIEAMHWEMHYSLSQLQKEALQRQASEEVCAVSADRVCKLISKPDYILEGPKGQQESGERKFGYGTHDQEDQITAPNCPLTRKTQDQTNADAILQEYLQIPTLQAQHNAETRNGDRPPETQGRNTD